VAATPCSTDPGYYLGAGRIDSSLADAYGLAAPNNIHATPTHPSATGVIFLYAGANALTVTEIS